MKILKDYKAYNFINGVAFEKHTTIYIDNNGQKHTNVQLNVVNN